MPSVLSTLAVAAAAAAASLPSCADAVGVLAKLQGVTEEGHSCDEACVRELHALSSRSESQPEPALSVFRGDHSKATKKDLDGERGRDYARAPEDPLILTKLMQQGLEPAAIRAQSEVSPQIGNYTSYSGFFTTDSDPANDNNMFFWYLPAQNGNTSAPTLIWLQGGPGGSSLFGMFCEMGPFNVDADGKLYPNPYTWNDKYGMLFIDNPVGAGFSYTGTGKGYVTDEDQVGDNLYSLLQQFYQVFPDVLKTDLYVTGESYGGHYVPAITYKIHEMNQAIAAGEAEDSELYGSPVTIPLKGFAIGDGWIDPVVQITGYPDMMFNLGLADLKQKEVIQNYCDEAVAFIQEGSMLEAFNVWDEMLNGDVYPYPNYFHNITGSNDYDNILRTNAPAAWDPYADYLNTPATRAALHVGAVPYGVNASDCEHHLLADFHATMVPRFETLLDAGYKAVIYSGQLDVIIGAALTERFLPRVNWAGQQEYIDADRMVWRINPDDVEVAGFVRHVRNLHQVIIRGAGHICPADQPARSYDMITRMVENIPYSNLPDPTTATGQQQQEL